MSTTIAANEVTSIADVSGVEIIIAPTTHGHACQHCGTRDHPVTFRVSVWIGDVRVAGEDVCGACAATIRDAA
jgi:hypothetical protein